MRVGLALEGLMVEPQSRGSIRNISKMASVLFKRIRPSAGSRTKPVICGRAAPDEPSIEVVLKKPRLVCLLERDDTLSPVAISNRRAVEIVGSPCDGSRNSLELLIHKPPLFRLATEQSPQLGFSHPFRSASGVYESVFSQSLATQTNNKISVDKP